jgi:hypothetical protein
MTVKIYQELRFGASLPEMELKSPVGAYFLACLIGFGRKISLSEIDLGNFIWINPHESVEPKLRFNFIWYYTVIQLVPQKFTNLKCWKLLGKFNGSRTSNSLDTEGHFNIVRYWR